MTESGVAAGLSRCGRPSIRIAVGPRPRDPAVEHLEAVGQLGEHEQVDVDSRGGGAAREEQRVVEQVVAGADAHEARRQAAQVGERGRDLGRAPLLVGSARQVLLRDEVRGLGAQHVEAVVRTQPRWLGVRPQS